jgi:hypothetical protein
MRAQETITNRFDFSIAAGVGYNRYADLFSDQNSSSINLDFPKLIFVSEINLNYRLKEGRYIGLNYSKLNYFKVLNTSRHYADFDVTVELKNYKNFDINHHFGILFGQEFLQRLHFGIGLSYFIRHFNRIEKDYGEGVLIIRALDESQRIDDMALTAFLDYYFPVKSYVQIGLRTKGFLTMYGFEAISLTPVLKFSF